MFFEKSLLLFCYLFLVTYKHLRNMLNWKCQEHITKNFSMKNKKEWQKVGSRLPIWIVLLFFINVTSHASTLDEHSQLTHSHQDDVTKTQKLKDLCESYYLTHLNNTCNENSVSKKKGQYVRKAIGWRKITKKASFHYICQKKNLRLCIIMQTNQA